MLGLHTSNRKSYPLGKTEHELPGLLHALMNRNVGSGPDVAMVGAAVTMAMVGTLHATPLATVRRLSGEVTACGCPAAAFN
ncbi:hypothetical protein GCM10023153_08090 [Ornithinibacter aureus]|uniref:Uncharacterized protein n=1 Tax=Ornithinibacter aureus TaxID=622664 RepID=A0ABP8JHB9_9MICO